MANIIATGFAGLETRAGAFLNNVVKKFITMVLQRFDVGLVLEVILKVRVTGRVTIVVAMFLNKLFC